jgi:quercetin dioxygenase-like cupin family protein
MKNLSRTITSVVFATLSFTLVTKTAVAQDAVKVDPKHYKVEVENDHVRALRISYGPHEKGVMHEHPASMAIFLTDGKGKFTYPDGKTEEISWKAGQALWLPAIKHLGENLTDKPFELIQVELKVKEAKTEEK